MNIVQDTAVFAITTQVLEKNLNTYDVGFYLIGDVSYELYAKYIVNGTIYTDDPELSQRLEQFLYLLLTQTIMNQLSDRRSFINTLIQISSSSAVSIMLDQLQ